VEWQVNVDEVSSRSKDYRNVLHVCITCCVSLLGLMFPRSTGEAVVVSLL
jgi:hypothetical protein